MLRMLEWRLVDWRHAVICKSYLQQRTIHTGIDDIEIKVPKVKRSAAATEYASSAYFIALSEVCKKPQRVVSMSLACEVHQMGYPPAVIFMNGHCCTSL
ncbi:MAG: hypothetical protein ACTS73_04375 [Arsenophonus sp. NEOnobi-MAG3]